METAGRVALVTGAARRVGRATALELAAAGCDVAVHYHNSADEARLTVQQIRSRGRRAVAVQADLADATQTGRLVQETADQLGRLDILVNNASVFASLPMDDWSTDHWEHMLRVNLIAPAMLARAAVPHMRQAGAGRIINLTDILAERPLPDFDAYCASKAALVCLTRSLARELAPDITVNAIAPGIAVFPESYDAALRAKLVRRVPLARPGSPEDIARAVLFLVASGDYITGEVLTVDGGRSIVP